MLFDDAPIFSAPISTNGRLFPDFRDYAQEQFTRAREKFNEAAKNADIEMAQGQLPGVRCFITNLPKPVDEVEMRTLLADFTLDADHQAVMYNNRNLNFRLHTDMDEPTRADSIYFEMHKAYEHSLYQRDITYLETSNLVQGHSQTPGMQAFLLDIIDARGDLQASALFQLGDRSAYCAYHFYRPEMRKQSIGRFAILSTMMTLKEAGECDYFYIGAFRPSNPHYRWKSRLKPAELWVNGAWLPMNSRTGNIIRKKRYGGLQAGCASLQI